MDFSEIQRQIQTTDGVSVSQGSFKMASEIVTQTHKHPLMLSVTYERIEIK